MSEDELFLSPFGLVLDLWEAHRQFLGWAKPAREVDVCELYRVGR